MNPKRPSSPSSAPMPPGFQDGPSTALPSNGTSPPSRKYVSAACEACKRRRRKCSRNQPCDACTRSNTECVFVATEYDGRSKQARKRKVQDLQSDADLLNELIEMFQESNDEEVDQLMSKIRGGDPVEDIKTHIRRQIAEERAAKRQSSSELEQQYNPPRDGVMDTTDSKRRSLQPHKKVMDVDQLTDEPPYRVPASPWTEVTDDDTLVSNLVSSWLCWDKPLYNWFDEELFLRDMRRGDMACQYCSPFMVNAILAVACPYSNHRGVKTQRGSTSELMDAFLSEAMRLLDGYNTRPSITTAQSLAFLYCAHSYNGQDSVGMQYLKHAASMCKGLQIKFPAVKATGKATPEERAFSQVLDKTCWGIFNLMAMSNKIYHKEPGAEMLQPSRPLPMAVEDGFVWTPYPDSGPARPSYSNELMHHFTSLAIIVQEVVTLVYGKNGLPSEQDRARLEGATLQLYVRLLQWYRTLPEHLFVHTDSPPSVLTYQSYWHSVVMCLFAPLLRSDEAATPRITEQAFEVTKTSALHIVEIIRIHRSLYGSRSMSVFLSHPITAALYALLEADAQLYSNEIFDLCAFFRAMTPRWPTVMAACRMFQVTAQKRGTWLPPATQQLFDDFEDKEWRDNDLRRVISMLPIMGDEENINPNMHNMSDFYEMFERLDVGS